MKPICITHVSSKPLNLEYQLFPVTINGGTEVLT
jgi:hypothetical protein